MNLMTPETALQLAPTAESAGTAVDILFYAIGDCALGNVLVARSSKGVCAILLGGAPSELAADLARHFPKATLVANAAIVHDDMTKIARYADEPSEGLDLALDVRGTPLQRRVWDKIRAIPVGKTMSCTQLARLINGSYPRVATRVVANACAANRLALAIPCHRVIGTDSYGADSIRAAERTTP
jgi:AraC family transcriptional regulator of adaptative response/methylated-DNA-[protein]-cysteine methyltransferase